MNIRKAPLPMILALASIALAVPATAEATRWWWYDHEISGSPNTASPKSVEPYGELTLTYKGVSFECGVLFGGEIYNELFGVGEGTIDEVLTPAENCPTNKANCKVLKSTMLGLPWELEFLQVSDPTVTITGMKIENHLSEGCLLYGLPLTWTASGTVTGEFVNYEPSEIESKPGKIVFKKAPMTVGGEKAELDGLIRFGTELTAEAKF